MKLISGKKAKMGIAMTEYLIILGIVALGCICIFGLFGQEIKVVAKKAMIAMSGGENKEVTDIDASTAANRQTGMLDFIKGGNE